MSQKPKDKVMRVEIHTMAGSPLVLEDVSAFNVLLSDGGWLGILPGHTNLVAATVDGEARYTRRRAANKIHQQWHFERR